MDSEKGFDFSWIFSFCDIVYGGIDCYEECPNPSEPMCKAIRSNKEIQVKESQINNYCKNEGK